MTTESFDVYVRSLRHEHMRGNTTEMTFRTVFETFIKSLNPHFDLLHEPKRTQKLGAPDFTAYRKTVKVGYIETKDLDVNLDVELDSDQMHKYTESISNILLTNYTRFILLRDGKKRIDCELLKLSDLSNARFAIPDSVTARFLEMLSAFFDYNQPTITSPGELADELAKRAKLLKSLANERLNDDLSRVKRGESVSSIYEFYKGIEELIKDLKVADCADAYAQTIAYGLFLARVGCPTILDRNTAASYIPRSIGVIRRIFLNISGDSLPSDLSWVVDDIVDALNSSDMQSVLSEIDPRKKNDRDPFSFFYENFLARYDPAKRKMMGVYYTPRPVVNFIVNSVNLVLKQGFSRLKGLAEDDVTLLDPATGTGTFLWMAYLVSLRELIDAKQSGLIPTKITNHLLKHFYGFELLIAPYIFAHLKLSSGLKKWHYEIREDERVQVYYTNALDHISAHPLVPFLRELSDESRIADEVKDKRQILVVVSNPPYQGTSANKSTWIEDLLKKGYIRADGGRDDGYYKVDGVPLGERNPKWLQDDYVKFIRLAQWKIDTNGKGIVGYITNHAYLDNPTFRGMRRSLMQSFDKIYILNLHGNSQRKERCPDGTKDENVFDIKQGVAISLFVKSGGKSNDCRVFYEDLYGLRSDKFNWLDRNNVETVEWQELHPHRPHYLFIPRNAILEKEYESYTAIPEIFPINSVGIVTARDGLTIKWSRDEVWQTVASFAGMPTEDARKRYRLGEDSSDWKVSWAQQDLIQSGPTKEDIVPILFRPFDVRYTYYTGKTHGFHCRPRSEVMQHMVSGPNLGLLTVRQVAEGVFNHALITDTIVDDRITLSNKGIAYLFPLYLYASTPQGSNKRNAVKKPNIDQQFLQRLSQQYENGISAEELLDYVYAVLHSNAYRARYAGFLRIQFPRVPFVKIYTQFKAIADIGRSLIDLHLQRSKLPPSTKFEVQGTNIVESVKYASGKVFINSSQFFESLEKKVWQFEMGGYKVLDKWLKSRIGEELSSIEVEQFLQIVEIIKKTIEFMDKVDSVLLLPKLLGHATK